MAENKRDRFGKFTTPKKEQSQIAFIKQVLGGHRTGQHIDEAVILLEGKEVSARLLRWIDFVLDDKRKRVPLPDGNVTFEDSVAIRRFIIDEKIAPPWRDDFLSLLTTNHATCGTVIDHLRDALSCAIRTDAVNRLLPEEILPLVTLDGSAIHDDLAGKVTIVIYAPAASAKTLTADMAENDAEALPDWYGAFKEQIQGSAFSDSDTALEVIRHFAETARLQRRAA
jgi:hypothetical protein